MVITSELNGADSTVPEDLAKLFILPAVQSENPLPANPETAERLAALIEAVSQPHPQPVSPLPAMAAQVSGKTYVFDTNDVGYQSFSLVFAKGTDEAHLIWQARGQTMDLLVGLDDIFRFTEIGPMEAAVLSNYASVPGLTTSVKGDWKSKYTFHMSFQMLGQTSSRNIDVIFVQGKATVSMTDLVEGSMVPLYAKLQSP